MVLLRIPWATHTPAQSGGTQLVLADGSSAGVHRRVGQMIMVPKTMYLRECGGTCCALGGANAGGGQESVTGADHKGPKDQAPESRVSSVGKGGVQGSVQDDCPVEMVLAEVYRDLPDLPAVGSFLNAIDCDIRGQGINDHIASGGDDESAAATPVGQRCSYFHCARPDHSSKFHRIDQWTRGGGQDWSLVQNHILCSACFDRFKRRGTLERCRMNPPLAESEKRCTYAGCSRPTQSSKYYLIEKGRSTWGRDWSSVAGSVLCQACFDRFKRRGTLLHCPKKKEVAAVPSRCEFEGCAKPEESSRFHLIEGGRNSGGQDWAPIAGKVLCHACFDRYKRRGTLERASQVASHVPEKDRRCSYGGCLCPTESSKFHLVDEWTKSGGQDWNSLAGKVLCHACFDRFKRRGTLERCLNAPLAESQKRCSYKDCARPDSSIKFHQIGMDMAGSKEGCGGHDWSGIAGSVLCDACYHRFRTFGSLERKKQTAAREGKEEEEAKQQENKRLADVEGEGGGKGERRPFCSYEECARPHQSFQFYTIGCKTRAGGRDWSSLEGSVLCNACYNRYSTTGTLKSGGSGGGGGSGSGDEGGARGSGKRKGAECEEGRVNKEGGKGGGGAGAGKRKKANP